MADEKLLLFEGKDEQHVFGSLLNHHGIAKGIINFDPPFDGIDDLLEALPLYLRSNAIKRLGIVVDADTDISSRWQSIRNILIAGYKNAPRSPSPEGTIVEWTDPSLVSVPKVGVWIMPNNKLPGMLEDFVSFLGATADPLWDIADECLKHILEEHRRFKESQRIKAYIHTWLAWQKKPGTPLGQAITAKFLDADATHARQLIGWIRRLFDL
jgi:hypothetical protein